MKGLQYSKHCVYCIKQKMMRRPETGNGGKPCPPIWLKEQGKKLRFWSQVTGQLGKISMPREPCFWRNTAPASSEVLKQGIYRSCLIQIYPLFEPKGKTTTKKSRDMTSSPEAGQRKEENGSGQGTWRITSPGTLLIIVGWLNNKFCPPQINIIGISYVIPGTFSEPQLF